MSQARIDEVEFAGFAAAVPMRVRDISEDAVVFGDEQVRKTAESTGVYSRHIASTLCASDLCFSAADRLLDELEWDRSSLDLLVFVSQTPDYLLPATGCVLQQRLGLSKNCAAFDVNLGCSGYIYGLWLASSLIAAGGAQRVLLLAGDTISRIVSPQDRATALLFGDAGTATALERDDSAAPFFFCLGTDGSGHRSLIVPASGFREPRTVHTARRTEHEGGNVRCEEDLFMDGAEVFTFTLREVPRMVSSLLAAADWQVDSVEAWVMHQANRFMLQHLAKRMKLPSDRVVIALQEYGNTSSASIPLAMVDALAARLRTSDLRLVLAGFGVGFSWGAAGVTCGPMKVLPVQYVAEQGAAGEVV